jgi:iron complex outermembrane receptor protein
LASSTLLISVALGTTAVHAQTRPTTAAATNTIEELVVTAEKREQSLQDVPIAISAFTSEKRDLIGINTIQDMTNFTPGLNYSSAVDRTTIRGVGRLSNAHPVPVPVAVYDDGIYTTSTVTAGKSPIFTDRVEVLRGPQGTLYGRNSMGGAINVISKRPTEEFYAEVRGTVANYGRTLFEGAMSGPIAPGLQFRLAGNWEKQRNGYFTNVVPGMASEGNVVDQFYVEGQLQAKFGDHLDMWTKVFVSGWNNGAGGPGARAGYGPGPFNVGEYGATNISAGFACAPGGVVANVINVSPLGCANPASSDPRKFASDIVQSVSLDETYAISSQWTWHFDKADLKYVGGGLNYHYTLDQDNGGGSITSYQAVVLPFNPALPVASQPCAATNLFVAPGACQPLTAFPRQSSTYQEDYHNMSHELSLASTGDGPLQWIGGLYYYKEGYKQPVFTTLHNQPQLDGPITPAVAALTGPVGADFQRRLYDDRPEFEQESYAVYGQVDWKLTDTLKATLGLRWNHDSLTGTESVRVVCFATAACGTAPELLGSFTPPVDVTAAVVYGPLASLLTGGAPVAPPQGVVNNGKPGGVSFTPDGFATRRYDASWEATTGTAGLEWNPDRDTNLYARYSKGYLMGGFASGITSTLGQFPAFNPEHVTDYEVGLKKGFGRTLQVNVAVFYEDLKDYQAPLSVVSQTGGLSVSQSRYVNIPKSVIQGVEVEGTWLPIDNLAILATFDYNDGKVKDLTGIIDPNDPEALSAGAKPLTSLVACASSATPLCDVNTGFVQRPQNLSGALLPQSPKKKAAINATYTWDFERGSLSPSVSYIWRDKQYSSLFTRALGAAPSWDQWDARVTWKDKANKFSIIAYVKNIGNTLGYDGGAGASRQTGVYSASTLAALGLTACTGSANPCSGLKGTVPGTFNAVQGYTTSYPLTPPRTYGVEFQYRF